MKINLKKILLHCNKRAIMSCYFRLFYAKPSFHTNAALSPIVYQGPSPSIVPSNDKVLEEEMRLENALPMPALLPSGHWVLVWILAHDWDEPGWPDCISSQLDWLQNRAAPAVPPIGMVRWVHPSQKWLTRPQCSSLLPGLEERLVREPDSLARVIKIRLRGRTLFVFEKW